MRNKKIVNYLFLLTGAVLLLMKPATGRAQMFSVGNEPGRIGIPQAGIFLGLEPAKFEYKGDVPPEQGGGRFEFNGPLIRLRLESSGINLFLATGGRITGLKDVSYFDAGIKAGYGFTLLRKRRVVVQLPLQLVSSLTSVTNDQSAGSSAQFQQGGLIFGGGGLVRIHASRRIRLEANFVPSYGFSFATGGTFGGSLSTLEGQARLFIDGVFGDMGLSFGYDYNYKSYNIEENEFDYDLRSHSILVGLTF